MGDTREVEELLTRTLAGASTMFLSTCSTEGEPWGAGVFFAEADPFTLRLIVEASGRTLRNIAANPNVAIVVSTGSPFEPFLQGSADAVVDPDGIDSTKAALVAKSPECAPLLDGGMPVAAVRLDIQTWRVTDVANGIFPGVELQTASPVLRLS